MFSHNWGANALAGDIAGAKAAYEAFLTLWKDADPDIPILKQAKAEYAKLQLQPPSSSLRDNRVHQRIAQIHRGRASRRQGGMERRHPKAASLPAQNHFCEVKFDTLCV